MKFWRFQTKLNKQNEEKKGVKFKKLWEREKKIVLSSIKKMLYATIIMGFLVIVVQGFQTQRLKKLIMSWVRGTAGQNWDGGRGNDFHLL